MTKRAIDQDWEISQDKPPATPQGAILFLRNWLSQIKGKENDHDAEKPLIDVVTAMIMANHQEWWVGHHFGWGMSMRNLLRENGYGEQELLYSSKVSEVPSS